MVVVTCVVVVLTVVVTIWATGCIAGQRFLPVYLCYLGLTVVVENIVVVDRTMTGFPAVAVDMSVPACRESVASSYWLQ